jgi:hypothetical protein
MVLSVGRAEASKFELNGASSDGVIIDDDGAIVRTSNSNCGLPLLLDHCNVTGLATLIPSLINVNLTVFGEDPNAPASALTINQLYLAIVRVDAPIQCIAQPQLCQNLGAYYQAHPGFTWSPDAVRDPANPHTLVLLPVIIQPTNFAVGAFVLGLPAETQNFLNSLTGFSTDEVGFIVNFTGSTRNPFTLEVPSATAVPEPGTVVLVMLGLAGLAAARTRRS